MRDREEMPDDTGWGTMDLMAMLFTIPWLVVCAVCVVLVCIT